MKQSIIKNQSELATGIVEKDTLAILEAGLSAIDTETVLRTQITLNGDILNVAGKECNLAAYKHVYILGIGKAACTAAVTLEELFAGRVRDGVVVGISEKTCHVIDTYAGTHPLPTSINYTATKHLMDVASKATKDDLVLMVVSGGGSALMCSSMGECEQGTELFRSFLPSGGTIEELNTVRKHISSLKGGGLVELLHPATVIGLIFSDVPGGDLSAVASGPTYYDESTIHDAQAIIDRYDLGPLVLQETPKDRSLFDRVTNIPLVTNETALMAMRQKAESLGYKSILTSAVAYSTPEEIAEQMRAAAVPGTMVYMGGETKLSVPSDCVGKGGRNDFLALHMLENITDDQVFASVASDGRDNTEAAGAIVSDVIKQKARERGIRAQDYTHCFNSYPFFDQVGGHIITGPLESNVSDLACILTPPKAVEAHITDIVAEVVTDSRGRDTISVTVTAGDVAGTFSVPSGASTGVREVVAKPAAEAVNIILETVRTALVGISVLDQSRIDAKLHELDGTSQFSTIGGNTALGVSVAVLKAASAAQQIEPWQMIAKQFGEHKPQAVTPRLFVNLINGGKHAKHGSHIQEHQIIVDIDDPGEALSVVASVQGELRQRLEQQYGVEQVTIGDEGGFVIPTDDPFESFAHIDAAISAVSPNVKVYIGADIAASSYYKNDQYDITGSVGSAAELHAFYKTLHQKFPRLLFVEDPFDESAFSAFARYQATHSKVVVIGDDLTTTNVMELQRAIKAGAISGIIIKPNQIGTVTDTLATMRLAYAHGVKCIVSHRSGETMDNFIADLAYGTKSYGLKAGAPTAPERAAKYDRLRAIT